MFKKILMVAAVFALGAAAPAAAQYGDLVVNPRQVSPGGTVSVSGNFCNPGEDVVITLRPTGSTDDGIEVATTVADDEGEFSTSFDVPADTAPGSYDVIVTCGDNTRTQTIEVVGSTVTPPTTPPTTPGTTPPGTPPGTPGGPSGTPGGPSGTPGGPSGTGDLPTTGSDLNGYGLIGAGLLTVGGLFLLGARKRRSTTAA